MRDNERETSIQKLKYMIMLVRAERRMIWEKAKPPRELEGTHFKYLQMQVPVIVTVKV